jgi:hypothetical protein
MNWKMIVTERSTPLNGAPHASGGRATPGTESTRRPQGNLKQTNFYKAPEVWGPTQWGHGAWGGVPFK